MTTWTLERPFAGEVHYVAPDATVDVVVFVDRAGASSAILTTPSSTFDLAPLSAELSYLGARIAAGYGRSYLRQLAGHERKPFDRCGKAWGNIQEARRALHERMSDDLSAARSRPSPLIVEAIRLVREGELTSVASLASAVGASVRTLHRHFLTDVGVSPKAMIRVERARRCARAIATGGQLAPIAADCGFADQAHMTRELQSVLGFSARALRNRPTLAEFFKPSPA